MVLLSFDVSEIFGGGSEVVSKFYRRSRTSWLDSHPLESGVSALVNGSDIIWDLRSDLVVGSSTF